MKDSKVKRNVFIRCLSMYLCVGMLLSSLPPAVPVRAADGEHKPIIGSRVVYGDDGYEREQVLEVGGVPFFYNGVQIRIDKVKDSYGYTDEQIKQLIQTAKDDGFTVANMQIRWSDIQPDTKVDVKNAIAISESTPDRVQERLSVEGCDSEDDHFTYLNFDLSRFEGQVEAAKLRVFLAEDSSLGDEHVLTAYDITEAAREADLTALTWNTAPVTDVSGLEGSATKAWDPVKETNCYDIDVTDFINEQLASGKKGEVTLLVSAETKEEGSNSETIFIEKDEYMPQLIVSEDKSSYDWSYLDKIIGWAEEIGIKMEVLWFATDTCSITADNRVPYYVHHNYQLCMADEDKPYFDKKSGESADIYGVYWYLMCKNDRELRSQEASALKEMFDHIGAYNAEHGYKNTVVGCQVANEPNISRMHGGSVYDRDGNKIPHCMCDICLQLKSDLGLDDQGFRDYTMFEYCNNLAKAVKTSDYPVWTRVNNVMNNDAWGVSYNEEKRTQGGTDQEGGTYLDFIGLDPYGYSRNALYKFGTSEYRQGQNLPVVMESGGENSMSALMMLATVAGGAFYNVYDLCSPDGHHLYDQDMQPRVIDAGDKYLPEGGTYIQDVRNHNALLNKIAYELAVKNPDSVGGGNMLFFNCEGTDNSNIQVTKQMGGVDITYRSNTKYSSGIAVKRSNTEVILLNTRGEDASFTLSQIGSDIKNIESGYYEGSEWIADQQQTEIAYTVNGSSLEVSMPAFSCLRVETKNGLPGPTYYELDQVFDEGKAVASQGLTMNSWEESGAHGGRWLEIKNAPEGSFVSFHIQVPEDLDMVQISTGYKANSSGRATVQLSVNGMDYGTPLNMTGTYGYTASTPGPLIRLKAGEVNTFTYTVVKAGHVCLDYIDLIKRESMPEELEGKALINEDFSGTEGSFGFPKGASVTGGQLNITQNMGNYTTSVKSFEPEIIGQTKIELAFDWKTNITSAGKKSGLEFRDLYGRLIFALASKGGTELRYSVSGKDSDSERCEYEAEPSWSSISMDRGHTYTVHLQADFQNHMVSYSITDKSTGNLVAQEVGIVTEASQLAKLVAANYYTQEAGTNYNGTQNIDNFRLIGTEGDLSFPHMGERIYVFGDDIADGHVYEKAGYVKFVAAKEGMEVVYDGSQNGATVIESGNCILSQITKAPQEAPDMVILNGGMNDAKGSMEVEAFREAFQEILLAVKTKWPQALILYTTCHRISEESSGISSVNQQTVYEIGKELCQKFGVSVADLYMSGMDTRQDSCRNNMTFDEVGSDGLPGTMATISSEKFSGTYPSGIYPNFRGIEEYYVPIVSGSLPKKEMTEEEAIVQEDKMALTLPSVTKEDFELPQKGEKGSAIQWSVEENPCIALQGATAKVTQTDQDVSVTLSAELTFGSASDRKQFIVVVPGQVLFEENLLALFTFDGANGFVGGEAKAEGNCRVDDGYDGKALYLDGSASNYLTVTKQDQGSLLTGLDEMTVSFEMKPDRTDINWPFYASPGSDGPQYRYENYVGIWEKDGALEIERYKNDGERPENPGAEIGNDWVRVDAVFEKNATTLYVNGQKRASMESEYKLTDILGDSSILQIGKANWGSGEYFKGWLDNFRILDRALTAEEVELSAHAFLMAQPLIGEALVGQIVDKPYESSGMDDHTAVSTKIDEKTHTISSWVLAGTDLSEVKLTLELTFPDTMLQLEGNERFENGGTADLSQDRKLKLIYKEKTEEWTIKTPQFANNPALKGKFADPDIDVFDGKYWIYPTTDGTDNWGGTQFHAFSSDDLVHWKDEGVILDVADKNPGLNSKGVQIGSVAWSVGSAWAPAIEEKNGKYYFYFCAKDETNTSAIGVAVSDSPSGPFVAQPKPLITKELMGELGIKMGQTIDPSIYTEEETGTSYLLFGNWYAAIVELGEDMVSIKKDTMQNLMAEDGNSPKDYCESIIVVKRNGVYHFTWSCSDTRSTEYRVNYGTSDSLYGPITYQYNVLKKDVEKDILGTGHHSILNIPGTDKYYVAYHRFCTPLGQITGDARGYHREVCLEPVTFDADTGLMNPVTPTMEGITEPVYVPGYEPAAQEYTVTIDGTVQRVQEGQQAQKPEDPTKEGFLFLGWYEADQLFDFNTPITRDITLTAKWKKKEPVNVTYTVTIDGQVQRVQGGQKIQRPADPVKEGYVFLGWYEGDHLFDFNVPVSRNVTLSSRWMKKLPAAPSITPDPKKVKKGDEFKINSALYKVTSVKKRTVAYQKPLSKKRKNVEVPSAVTINGKRYKVTAISAKAFYKNMKLKKVVIGKNVQSIGKNAFRNSKRLKSIEFKGKKLKAVGNKAFSGVARRVSVKAPRAKKKTYLRLLRKRGGMK